MAELIFTMIQSADGYVASEDGELVLPPPGPELFHHFTDIERGLAGGIYGRRMYEVMRYWDDDQPHFDATEHAFAAAWRAHPKWVVSSTLKSVGPNATLVTGELEPFVRGLKERIDGTIAVAGPALAARLAGLDLLDTYEAYLRPFVLGRGKPFFAGARPPLKLVSTERVGEDAVRLVLAAR